jgi:hypothetical protein
MGKTEGRGGKRKGAGRKPASRIYSDAIKQELTEELQKLAVQHGTSWLAELGKMALGKADHSNANAQLGAMKLVADILVVKESVKTVESLPGVVELPSRAADPVHEEGKVTVQ